MNNKIRYLLLLVVILIVFTIPGTAMAKELQDDQVVAGGTFTLRSGEELDGSLIIFGGSALVENQAVVEGDVVVLGGIVTIDGLVEGNVVGIGGVVNLNENAFIDGDLTTVAATLNKEPGAEVNGQVITNIEAPAIRLFPETLNIPTIPEFSPAFRTASYTWRVFWFILRTLLWGALAALVVVFLPKQTSETSKTIAKQPLLSGGLGLVSVIITPVVLFILLVTCIFSPIALIGGFAFAVAWIFGIIAIGFEIGQRIAKAFDREWALPVLAGIGTIGLAFIVDGIYLLVSPAGLLLRGLVGIFGLGAVLLTRFGTRPYPAETEAELSVADELPPPSGYEETTPESIIETEAEAPDKPGDKGSES